MKVKPKHYEKLKSKIIPLAPLISAQRDFIKTLPNVKDIEMRLRWDLLYASKQSDLISEIYQYANDSHIDTALRQIMKEIES